MAREIEKPQTPPAPMQRCADPFSAMRAEFDRVVDNFLGRGASGYPMRERTEHAER